MTVFLPFPEPFPPFPNRSPGAVATAAALPFPVPRPLKEGNGGTSGGRFPGTVGEKESISRASGNGWSMAFLPLHNRPVSGQERTFSDG